MMTMNGRRTGRDARLSVDLVEADGGRVETIAFIDFGDVGRIGKGDIYALNGSSR